MIYLVAAAAAVTLLLLCRVKAEITYDGAFHIVVSYLFVRVRMKQRGQGKAKPETQRKKAPAVSDIRRLLRLLRTFADPAKRAFSAMLRHLRVDILSLRLVICTSDAAQTAILYGEACSAVYPALAFVCGKADVRRRDVSIEPVFDDEGESSFSFGCRLSMRLGGAIAVTAAQAVAFMITLFRQNLSKNKKPAKDGASR